MADFSWDDADERGEEATDGGTAVASEADAETTDDTEAVDGREPEEPPEQDRGLVADHPIKGEVLREAKAWFNDADLDETFATAPSTNFIKTKLFDFSYLDSYDEVERIWVNKPFAYVSILRDPQTDKLRYHVHEPILTEFEEYVREDLVKILRNSLMYQDLDDGDDREAVFERKVDEIIDDHAAATVEDGTLHKLKYYLIRDFVHLGPIDPIMRDPNIEDVSCDGVDIPVYVYHFEHRDLPTNITFDGQELSSFALRLAQRAGEQISVSEPLMDGTLPDGSRVQLTFGSDVSTRGSNFTIRKFANIPFTPVDLIERGTFSVEQMAYFWMAIENNRSLIFSGGTGSGKTTSMNAVSMFIPEDSKVVSIEDTREITLPHDNWIQSLTRDSITSEGRGEVSMYELLQAALRQRPEYLLVGEIRTEQNVAFTFFQAIGTGHTAYTTIHAESVAGVLNRLENDPLSVPTQMILDLDIISVQKQTFLDGDRVRRNDGVTEIRAGDDGGETVRAIDVFNRDADADAHQKMNNSQVLQDIADDRGWSKKELAQERRKREEFLQYLLENDITGYHEVTNAIHAFGNEEVELMRQIEEGTLSPADLTE
ncbi:type II/IV secretion system ATPase subunit [Halorarius halobius]|uniref:type II/IV secretion system ATPase subunit n=1 Tax=Halorarius halobius TaxID=2962671 RepID=UPI0020CD1E49|nr:type II/IV secretion system ATPase subunit [Halorarius halobius]